MARNKLGIIQLELPKDYELDDVFNSGTSTEITDLLTEEQKEIIKTLGGSKLVLIDVENLSDSYPNTISKIKGLMNIGGNGLTISIYIESLNQIVSLSVYEDSEKYYILS